MELRETIIVAATLRSGHDSDIDVVAGQSLKIETSPDGEDILDIECPVGKVWKARVIVEITETDAI